MGPFTYLKRKEEENMVLQGDDNTRELRVIVKK